MNRPIQAPSARRGEQIGPTGSEEIAADVGGRRGDAQTGECREVEEGTTGSYAIPSI